MPNDERRITSVTAALHTLSLSPSIPDLIWDKKVIKLQEEQEKAREEELRRQTGNSLLQ
jgi:hypothetical protein